MCLLGGIVHCRIFPNHIEHNLWLSSKYPEMIFRLCAVFQAWRGSVQIRQHLHHLHPERRPHQGGHQERHPPRHHLWYTILKSLVLEIYDQTEMICIRSDV